MCSRPVAAVRLDKTVSFPRSSVSSARCAYGRNVRPASVRRTPLPTRSNSGSPRSFSSRMMRVLSVGCVTPNSDAARLNECTCTVVRNASSWPISITIPLALLVRAGPQDSNAGCSLRTRRV
ncbi:MAG: hypothetical protein OXE02_03325 [Chloroflexi bacterium]|nr:hypothetical protein [Chloroflexota bacterium]